MGANVYANGMEVSGGASAHNVIASMPDVCLSPPTPPAGPIPIPYPNFAKSSDLTDGSSTVQAGGKGVTLKDQSSYKQSNGDEAATKAQGMGLLSANITGPVKHKAASFDVKFEGAGVVRNLDLTTGNHSNPGDGCLTVDTAGVAVGMGDADCAKMEEANSERRGDAKQGEQTSTVTHAKIERPGQPGVTVWSSSRKLGAKFRNGGEGYVSGLERAKGDTVDQKKRTGGDASNMCADAKKQMKKNNGGRTYAKSESNSRPHTSHTEARILESLFAGGAPPAGTKVTMAIQWNQDLGGGKFGTSSDPCDNCRKLICAAEKCGITILICDEGEPADVKTKTGESCP